MALKGSKDAFESDEGFDPVTVTLLGKELVLITFPVEHELVFTLRDVINMPSPFSNTLLGKLLFLLDIPEGEEVRNEAFPVSALLSKEPVAAPSSSSSSPCSSSDEEAVVDESSSASSALKKEAHILNISLQIPR